jgi:hypothetical protein
MITYILLLLMSADPNPTFMMMAEFPTKKACTDFVESNNFTPPQKARLVCQGFVLEDAPAAPPK